VELPPPPFWRYHYTAESYTFLFTSRVVQSRPGTSKTFGTGPQMLRPGSRTAHVNTTASDSVIYLTDKLLCHF
jgi:hypothetical protein